MTGPAPRRRGLVCAIEQTLGSGARYNPSDTTHPERFTPVVDQQLCRQRPDAHFNGLPTRWQTSGVESWLSCGTGSCP